jgi:hypothetical protein
MGAVSPAVGALEVRLQDPADAVLMGDGADECTITVPSDRAESAELHSADACANIDSARCGDVDCTSVWPMDDFCCMLASQQVPADAACEACLLLEGEAVDAPLIWLSLA